MSRYVIYSLKKPNFIYHMPINIRAENGLMYYSSIHIQSNNRIWQQGYYEIAWINGSINLRVYDRMLATPVYENLNHCGEPLWYNARMHARMIDLHENVLCVTIVEI